MSLQYDDHDMGTALGRYSDDPALAAFRTRALERARAREADGITNNNHLRGPSEHRAKRVVRPEVVDRVLRGECTRVDVVARQEYSVDTTPLRVVRRGVVDRLMLQCEILDAQAANERDNSLLAEAETRLREAELAREKQQLVDGLHQRLRTSIVNREIETMGKAAELANVSDDERS